MSRTEMAGMASGAVATLLSPFLIRRKRTAHKTARELAARGAGIHAIARRTGLPRDVVAMLVASCAIPAAAPRQKMPSAAAPAAATQDRRAGANTGLTGNSKNNNNLQIRSRGTGVALA